MVTPKVSVVILAAAEIRIKAIQFGYPCEPKSATETFLWSRGAIEALLSRGHHARLSRRTETR